MQNKSLKEIQEEIRKLKEEQDKLEAQSLELLSRDGGEGVYSMRPAARHVLTIGEDLIQDQCAAIIELVKNAYDADSPDAEIVFSKLTDESVDKNENIVRNKKGEYYHWLPDNSLYKGGWVNFRKLMTCPLDQIGKNPQDQKGKRYEYQKIRIQGKFVKDILQRFSAYYARQGQPDFDFKKEAEKRTRIS